MLELTTSELRIITSLLVSTVLILSWLMYHRGIKSGRKQTALEKDLLLNVQYRVFTPTVIFRNRYYYAMVCRVDENGNPVGDCFWVCLDQPANVDTILVRRRRQSQDYIEEKSVWN